jgi:hypothetical protein
LRSTCSEEIRWIRERLSADPRIPQNFVATLPFHDPAQRQRQIQHQQPRTAAMPSKCGNVISRIGFPHFCVLQTVFSASSVFKINPQTLAILELLQLPDVFTAAFDGARRAPAATASTSAQSFSFSADISSAAASTSSSMYSTLASLASSNPEEISLDDVAHPASAAASLSNPEEIPLD